MHSSPPDKARAVIIGGGVSGCSVAYHLSKLGWKDIVLLERKQLTCGTTWHAAGLIGQLRNTKNMTRLARYSADLYARLEDETEVATGMRRNGSISIALTNERLEEFKRAASLGRAFEIDVHELSPKDILERYPYLNVSDVIGGIYIPTDGQCDPTNIAMALAKGARNNGAIIIEGIKVTEVKQTNNQVCGVDWVYEDTNEKIRGFIQTDIVINCAGMWARELADQSNVCVPIHACEHFYVVSEAIVGLPQLPSLRVPDECAYYKEDAGKILLGIFEPHAKPWGMDGIPENFCFDELPEDFEHIEPQLEAAMNRFPLLRETGIHTFFNGPESFTPDDRYYLGEAPELRGYWVAAGYNSIGIVSSGGAGFALANWINDGVPPFDLWEVDIRRVQPYQKNKQFLRQRVTETLGLLYADHFPYRQFDSARGIRRSPLHDAFLSRGAVMGETAGWERANWFAKNGQNAEYDYSWKRQSWFENTANEHNAIRTGVGLYDMTSFGKIRIEGKDAVTFLNNICANQIDVSVGKIVYTQMLNERGGIESDLTVTRLSETAYLLVVPTATLQRNLAWLRHHHSDDQFVVITDVTSAESVICIMGPQSRDFLETVSPHDWSNEFHPFGFASEVEIGFGLARAHRVTYVGELGFELYVATDQAVHVFEEIWSKGEDFGLRLCGLHAMDSCRLEKAYRHFGHDISDEDHVLEAGLGFVVSSNKECFIGRDAVQRKREQGLKKRLVQFKLEDPNPLLYHNEPIVRENEIVGYLTSGNYGHHLGAAIGMGYVPCEGISAEELLSATYQIEIAGERFNARASLKPFYDPTSDRIRA